MNYARDRLINELKGRVEPTEAPRYPGVPTEIGTTDPVKPPFPGERARSGGSSTTTNPIPGDRPAVRGKSGTAVKSDVNRPRIAKGASDKSQWSKIAPYAITSLICFLCGFSLLALLISKADTLGRLGLTGNLYYLILLPMGLAASGFLFGVLRSYARYRGKQLGGVFELGGPILAFAMVVIGGFVLVPNLATFPFTVYRPRREWSTRDRPQKLWSGGNGLGTGPAKRANRREGAGIFPGYSCQFSRTGCSHHGGVR